MRERIQGLSLLEFIMALAVIAVTSTLAVPGFNNLRHGAGRTAAVNSFIHAVFLARSEAIKRGVVVTLCKSSDGQRCMNANAYWSDGWIVFANTDRDDPPVRDPDEPVIEVYPGWQGGRITSNRKSYSFRSHVHGVVNGTVVFCDPRGSKEARAVIISRTGRPRLAQRDSSNKPLRCPAS